MFDHSSEEFIVQVHGGAWDIPKDLEAAHEHGTAEAYKLAQGFLQKGMAPLDVVVEALAYLEDDPTFDAGTGSFLNEHGTVELDAAIMDGSSLGAGAVACIGSFPNPSRIARAVLTKTPHVLLAGAGAEEFALREGFSKVPAHELVHPREIAAHEKWLRLGKPDAKSYFSSLESQSRAGAHPDKRGTVGVVIGVRQKDGAFHLFAGTSTGGTPGKRAGRVGDVPLVGSGLYADNESAAVSCTGWGEGLMRVVAAKSVCMLVGQGLHPQEAIESVLAEMFRRTGGRGGIIAIDRQGRSGAAFSTPAMAFAGTNCRALHL